MVNYEQMIVSTLKNLARERGLRGYSRLRKSELIRKLRKHHLKNLLEKSSDNWQEREVYVDTLGLENLSYFS